MTGSSPTPAPYPPGRADQRGLVLLAMALFFAFGFCTVLVDTLVPKLKGVFQLSYAEVMLTQFSYFLAYAIVSLPAGWLLTRLGYLKAVTVGLVIMVAGCLLFTPAARLGTYEGFLLALFILASGVTIVQVAANPLAANAGDPARASSRLTLAQAFNSLATMVGPIFGAWLILRGDGEPAANSAVSDAASSAAALAARRVAEAKVLEGPFIGIAMALVVLAAVCWLCRSLAPPASSERTGAYAHLFGRRRLMLGTLAIFTYVGAEVAIGSSLANYLMLPQTLGAPMRTAGALVSVYWGLAMVGRFAGAVIMRRVSPALLLSVCAVGAIALCAVSGLSGGMVAAVAILAVGLFNSIMFPTIFSLAIEGLGEDTPQGSGLLCVAIVGGAIVPVVTGAVADHVGLAAALAVPLLCYVWIAAYGLVCRRDGPHIAITPR